MPTSAIIWDPRPRPGALTSETDVSPTRDPRPRPNVRLNPAFGSMDVPRSTGDPKPQRSSINLPTSIQPYPELSLPSPSTPSYSCGQVVAMNPPAGRQWLTREDLKKLPKIPKIRCEAKVAPISASGLGPEPMFTISTSVPMTPPQVPLNLRNSSDSGITTRPLVMQTETGLPLTITQQRPLSPQTPIGQNSRQATATKEPFCLESSQVSLPITPPLTPTEDFNSRSLSKISNGSPGATASSMKKRDYYTSIQERDDMEISWGRNNGVQSRLKPETKEFAGPLESSQNKFSDFRSASPLKNTRNISSQVQKSSPLARSVTDANGGTVTQRAVDYLSAPTTRQTRPSKEFNMDSYNSCDCRSDGGEECMCCRILKGAFEFCQRVDQMVKKR